MPGVKTQGTQLYWRRLNGAEYSIVPVRSSSLAPGGGGNSPIDVTDLQSTAAESIAGLLDNGALTVNANLLPWNHADADDQVLFLGQASGDESLYIIGMADGTAAPTVDDTTGVVTYSTARSWRHFTGSYGGTPLEQINAKDAARLSISIQISGAITRVPRSA